MTAGNVNLVTHDQSRFSEMQVKLSYIFYAVQNKFPLFFVISDNIFKRFH